MKDKPSFEKYQVSTFQRNIIGNMDDDNRILSNAALNVTLDVNNTQFSPDEVAQGLFGAMLRDGDQNLNSQMLNCVLLGTEDNLKEKLLRLWSDLLTGHIQVTINGGFGDSVDFPAFHNTPTSNFTEAAWQSANAIIYPSVYVYAMDPYSWMLSIVPNGLGFIPGVRWEQRFFGPDQVNQKIPDFANTPAPTGWLTTRQIAVLMRIHAYNRLIVEGDNDRETTIFNN